MENSGVTEGTDLRLGDCSLDEDPVDDLYLTIVKVEVWGEED